MCGSDVYEGFRDGRGRFTEGNPGRQRGTFTWLSGEVFSEKYPFLVVEKPGVCGDCGFDVYRYNIRWDGVNTYIIRCKCNNCNSVRYYRAYSESWSSI